MSGSSCEIYADSADLAALVGRFSELGSLQYVETSSGLNCPICIFTDASQILPAAMVTPADSSSRLSFLVMHIERAVSVREIVRTDGSGTIRVADQNLNFPSVAIAFGGDAGDDTLIMSDINTADDSEEARALHRRFRSLVWSMTRRVGPKGAPIRLMPGAAQKAKAGWRLACGKGWSSETNAHLSDEERASL